MGYFKTPVSVSTFYNLSGDITDMLIEKKHSKNTSFIKNRLSVNPAVKEKPKADKSSFVVDKNYVLKDMAQIRTNLFITIGMSISYAVTLTFLIYKLLA